MSPGMNILQDPNQPWLLDKLTRDDLVCPLEHTCTPAGDAAGMYVRDTADGKVYFSEFGWQRYDEGADIDWVGVVKDLLIIVGGSIGGTGGLFSAVSQMLGVAGWGISLFHDNPPPR